VKIVAQIDTPAAIRNYPDLLRVSDAIMVSRTNLGMVIKPEKVCVWGGGQMGGWRGGGMVKRPEKVCVCGGGGGGCATASSAGHIAFGGECDSVAVPTTHEL
jgi:hypothetical protein